MATTLEKIKRSTAFVKDNTDYVKVNYEAIDKFVATIDEGEFKEKSVAFLDFPLKFNSPQEEINFLCILDILVFGSGYRHELHTAVGRGAAETIKYGVFSMYLQKSGKLTAEFLKTLAISDVASNFGLDLTKEVEVTSGITAYQPSPVKPLVEKIQKVLNESGKILMDNDYKDFGDFIWQSTKPKKDGKVLGSSLLDELVYQFPAFNDKSYYKGQDVLIFKKAQLLVADLYRKFKDRIPERFNFSDIDQLTVFADNVVPAVLREMKILELNPELAAQIDARQEIPRGPGETILRALAVYACEEIVKRLNIRWAAEGKPRVLAIDLDCYLWSIGKQPAYRNVERHATKDTIFY